MNYRKHSKIHYELPKTLCKPVDGTPSLRPALHLGCGTRYSLFAFTMGVLLLNLLIATLTCTFVSLEQQMFLTYCYRRASYVVQVPQRGVPSWRCASVWK